MAEPASPPPAAGPETYRGALAELLSFAGSLGRHVQALMALAGHESKAAASLYLRLLVMLVVAFGFAILGYVFLLLFLAFLLATVFGISWIWIALGFAVLHLVITAICAFQIKSHLPTPVFSATAAEIKQDLATLKNFES